MNRVIACLLLIYLTNLSTSLGQQQKSPAELSFMAKNLE